MGRIAELQELILHHKIMYYQGKPEISDQNFDKLEDELRKLDPDNNALKVVGSAELSKDKVKHEKKMLSLEKTYEEKGLKSWMKDHEVVSTFKLDGVACSLIYENGNIDDLAQKTLKALTDSELGNCARKRVLAEYDWRVIAPKLDAIYRG